MTEPDSSPDSTPDPALEAVPDAATDHTPVAEPEVLIAPPDPPAAKMRAADEAKPPKRRGAGWRLAGIAGFLILAAGEFYLWHMQQKLPDQSGQINALRSELASIQQSQAAPALAAPAQGAPAAPAPAAPAQTAPPQTAPTSYETQADLSVKLAALAAQINAMQTQFAADHGALTMLQANSSNLTGLAAEMTSDHAALTSLQADTADLGKLTAKAASLNQLTAASMALDAGQALGDIPNAPPALSQYAGTPPPTLASLILSFPQAKSAAEAASVAGTPKQSYWSVVLARLESLVTISNGARVIIGAPASGVIQQAQTLLDAGDLAGAVALLDTLSQPVQDAMSDWLTQAHGLLAARAAIVSLADQP